MITEIDGILIDFHQLIEHSPTSILIIKESKVVYANRSFMDLMDLSDPEVVLSQNIFVFFHANCYDLIQQRIEEVIRLNKHSEITQMEMIDSEGKIIHVEVVFDCYQHDNNRIIKLLIYDTIEKDHLKTLLRDSEKLSFMGEIAAGYVHEIRNPLTVIKGFLSLMNRKEGLKNKEYISFINKELARIEAIANDLLSLSKPRISNFQPQSLVMIIKYVIDLLETSSFKKRIVIRFEDFDDNLQIVGDEVQLKQAFINIIKNAIEATPREGVINVTAKDCNGKVKVTISDSGTGMSKEYLDQLGAAFFTTKEKGTGLGLMVTYTIIKNHNGTIQVESIEGEGTTFTFLFQGWSSERTGMYLN